MTALVCMYVCMYELQPMILPGMRWRLMVKLTELAASCNNTKYLLLPGIRCVTHPALYKLIRQHGEISQEISISSHACALYGNRFVPGDGPPGRVTYVFNYLCCVDQQLCGISRNADLRRTGEGYSHNDSSFI